MKKTNNFYFVFNCFVLFAMFFCFSYVCFSIFVHSPIVKFLSALIGFLSSFIYVFFECVRLKKITEVVVDEKEDF